MRKGLLFVSWVLAIIGAAVLFQATDPLTVVGTCLLIWANNVYESIKNIRE
jgi:hypothetical protein